MSSQVPMQRARVEGSSFKRGRGLKPPGLRAVVAGSQVIEARVRIELLSVVQVVVGRGSRAPRHIPEAVVVIGVGYRAGCVRQRSGRPLTIVQVKRYV